MKRNKIFQIFQSEHMNSYMSNAYLLQAISHKVVQLFPSCDILYLRKKNIYLPWCLVICICGISKYTQYSMIEDQTKL